jgi:hypothetical protein
MQIDTFGQLQSGFEHDFKNVTASSRQRNTRFFITYSKLTIKMPNKPGPLPCGLHRVNRLQTEPATRSFVK